MVVCCRDLFWLIDPGGDEGAVDEGGSPGKIPSLAVVTENNSDALFDGRVRTRWIKVPSELKVESALLLPFFQNSRVLHMANGLCIESSAASWNEQKEADKEWSRTRVLRRATAKAGPLHSRNLPACLL